MKTLRTDVVVIGGGAAGTYAALRLHQLGLKPLIIAKGLVGKSGASVFAGNLVLAGHVFGGSDLNAAAATDWVVRWYNHFLIDQDYAKKAEAWIENYYYPELDKAGLYIRRDNEGHIVQSFGSSRGAAANQQGQSGILFMDLRRKQVRETGIPTLEDTTVTRLLKDDNGAVIGVVALQYSTGELYSVECGAVIIATGPADRLATRSTGTREQSADGIALAYRAGAELLNLEIQWWHASDIRWPKAWQRIHIYPNPLVGTSETARMYNSDGECFFDQSVDCPNSYAPYPTQLKRLAVQAEKGKASFDGGYYTGYDHIDAKIMKDYAYQMKAFEKLGLSPERARVETAPTWHYRQGGINTNPHTMETSVPGLYVAGAVGGHSNGSLGFVNYDAQLVARTIASKIKTRNPVSLPVQQIKEEEARLVGFLRRVESRGVVAIEVKNKIREIMWNKMSFVKTTRRMEEAILELDEIRENAIPRMALENTTRRFNFGWVDAIDVFNMLDVCKASILSALNRKESRGPFYRVEYPFTDNKTWLVKNILCGEGDFARFRTEPYELPYYQPEFDKRDYFAVDW